jgi:diaminopimelate epimerase
MTIPFTKAHGAKNDFLLTWDTDVPPGDLPAHAVAICDRHTGIGADGWMLVSRPQDRDAEGSIRLYNSDGSTAEISGNGTRCAAAFLIRHGFAQDTVRIRTGAGVKHLRLLERDGLRFQFEMNMGTAEVRELRHRLPLAGGVHDVTVIWVGNPQCAMPVDHFDFDWRAMGAAIEHHAEFPDRTNVSFLRKVNDHTIDVRFWERGAGETMSSGTGSTGAAATAIARGLVTSPVRVLTPAGPIDIRGDGELFLTGPAELVAEGEFFVSQ